MQHFQTHAEQVLEQVCYFDCIDWVLTLTECAQICCISIEDVQMIATGHPQTLTLVGDMICLTGHESLCKQRQDRAAIQKTKWDIFQKQLAHMPRLPFVEILFASGSFSLGNCKESSDLDVLIVTTPGRIATARLFLTLWTRYKKIKRVNTHIQDSWCLNHYVTADAGLGPQNAYTGHLYSFLKPVFGSKTAIASFFQSIDWVSDHVPCGPVFATTPILRTRTVSPVEKFLEWRLGDCLESLLFTIQKTWFRYRCTNPEYEILNRTEFAFHPVPQEPEVLQKYSERLSQISIKDQTV